MKKYEKPLIDIESLMAVKAIAADPDDFPVSGDGNEAELSDDLWGDL